MTTPPTVFSPLRQFTGVAGDVAGTPAAPVWTVPLDSFDWNDKPTWLEDKAWRAVMANDAFAVVEGVTLGELSMAGPGYPDSLGWPLLNLMGDQSIAGTSTGTGGTTLSSAATAGATSITVAASIPAATQIQIGTGTGAEVHTTGTPVGTGPYTIPITTPLRSAQASGAAVQPVATPYITTLGLLNTGSGQPGTQSWTHSYGPTPTTGARTFTGTAFSEVALDFNVEAEFLKWTGKASSWASAPSAAAPQENSTSSKPVASWRAQLGVGGPASGGTLAANISSGTFTFTRALKPFYAGGSQNPYVIARGGFSVSFKLSFITASEAEYQHMMTNDQPQLQFVATNGATGAAALGVQVDMAQASFQEVKANYGAELISWDVTGKAVINTTNVGPSGGRAPATVSLTNAVTPYTYQ